MKQIFTSFLCLISSLGAFTQVHFSNATYLLSNATINSGAAMGVADVNGDWLDDIIRLERASDLNIGYQQADGSQFVAHWNGNVGSGSEWGMCIGDVDRDGYNDILVGGSYNHLKMHLMGPTGVDSSHWLPNPNIFLQAINMADINNDGHSDVFACHDDGLAAPFRNNGNNTWTHDTGLINPVSTVPSDNSGNYGSVWTDYDSDGDIDLYISKCRQGVSDPMDGRRINLLFENDGSNNYTDVAMDVGLVPYGQSWAADFGDIDNDGDMDCIVLNHDIPSVLYENQADTFVEITASAGLGTVFNNWGDGIQVVMDDFDNDGYIDMILTGRQGLMFLMNDGDKTFTETNAFPSSADDMHSCAVGDLNNDGSLDLVAGFANGFNSPSSKEDILFMNDGNDNHWIKAGLTGVTSNINGIGARVEVYSSLGKQIREVRSGESYGIQNSFNIHFGLGADTTVDSLVVIWPSGTRDVIWDAAIDMHHLIKEGCYPTGSSSVAIEEAEICEGESYNFLGQMLTEPGEYDSVVTTPQGCAVTHQVTLEVIETDIEVVQTGNTLTAAAGYDYQWIDCSKSNAPIAGETGQSFTPTVDGSYAVIVANGLCEGTSECVDIIGLSVLDDLFPFEIKVYPNPVMDMVQVQFSRLVRNAEISLYNIHGAAILSRPLDAAADLQLDMSSLPAGNYLLEIRHEGKAGVIRLVKN